ncbi:MAG TPA: di-heme oxidoredictase family protein [Polyangiaceae bacterium]
MKDPVTGVLRLGRFGWKAEKVDVRHQAAEAAFDGMGLGQRSCGDRSRRASRSSRPSAAPTAT